MGIHLPFLYPVGIRVQKLLQYHTPYLVNRTAHQSFYCLKVVVSLRLSLPEYHS